MLFRTSDFIPTIDSISLISDSTEPEIFAYMIQCHIIKFIYSTEEYR